MKSLNVLLVGFDVQGLFGNLELPSQDNLGVQHPPKKLENYPM